MLLLQADLRQMCGIAGVPCPEPRSVYPASAGDISHALLVVMIDEVAGDLPSGGDPYLAVPGDVLKCILEGAQSVRAAHLVIVSGNAHDRA